jgi:flagellar biosynthesis anti-sigma factor FlgM
MKVNEQKGVTDPRLGGVQGVRPGGGAEAQAAAGGDQVSLSDAARELARMRAQVGDVGAVDQQKVSGLTAVMAKGQYSADFRDVAKKMMRELLGDLLG